MFSLRESQGLVSVEERMTLSWGSLIDYIAPDWWVCVLVAVAAVAVYGVMFFYHHDSFMKLRYTEEKLRKTGLICGGLFILAVILAISTFPTEPEQTELPEEETWGL